MPDPFHEGERAIQEITGEREAALANGRIIADAVPVPAVPFVASQELAICSREDAEGRLWPGIVFGQKGFASVSDDRRRLTIAPTGGAIARGAPLDGLEVGDRLGSLFIELTTRRRLRVNGTVEDLKEDRIQILIEEAYPSCPKYIQRRTMEPISDENAAAWHVESGTSLTEPLKSWIGKADTMFVASGPQGGRLDISHRGGEPGSIQVVDGLVRVPDYPGNSMFNNLGNFHLDPRAGLVFLDFTSGRQLSLTGSASVHVEGPAEGNASGPTGGTDRWWTFTPEAWTITNPEKARRWNAPEFFAVQPIRR
ncbi:hypothetical protein B7H23_04655 [Notoacmeibacter marinus]|uniref:Uncharacterized protein n=1 Tax=Notoacmeibacter marinus TaxID=1876515 RepID=A0A231V239_9HYPH|nr:pyridoxamine 5'-phosphate oxidase family protein [Notoacmeibacter marinus]OXT02210.1 hypothetical protein B7H23_04655 [Notoacmeibacter marinus]